MISKITFCTDPGRILRIFEFSIEFQIWKPPLTSGNTVGTTISMNIEYLLIFKFGSHHYPLETPFDCNLKQY